MTTGILDVVKQVAVNAVDASKPTDWMVGTVVSDKPLKIKVSNTLILPATFLVVPKHLTDHTVDVTVSWVTGDKGGGSEMAAFETHNHSVSGKKKMTVHNALKTNDKVVLLRQQGGQKYFVLCKL